MKPIILVTLIVIVIKSFSQTPESLKISSEDYLQKSKNQKTTAFILLGSGAVIAAAGGFIQLNHENNHSNDWDFDFTGAYIAIAGCVVVLSSIPFFIISSNNAKKAMTLALSGQQMLIQQRGNLVHTCLPAVSLKIKF
jgi:hypothetical protein